MIGIWFPITQGKFALVDRDLYEEITKHKWQFDATRGGYVSRTVGMYADKKRINLHDEVMFTMIDEYVGIIDHKNRDKLDCRKENLRVATYSQNNANTKNYNGRKYRGVSTHKVGNHTQIMARIRVNGKEIYLGTYSTEEEAADVYDNAAIVFFGEFASLNCVWLGGR